MLTPAQQQFVDKMRPIAAKIEAERGIKPNIVITQSAHESRWGMSGLTVEANNLFGMIASDNWLKGERPFVEKKTWEESWVAPDKIRYWDRPGDIIEKSITPEGRTRLLVLRKFRKYASWDESVNDWALKFTLGRYAEALKAAQSGDLRLFANAMQKAGYATDGKYATKLIALGPTVGEALA